MSIQLMPETPLEALVQFVVLAWMDHERGTREAAKFAREYENAAPEGHFGVYLELLETGRAAVVCETGTA